MERRKESVDTDREISVTSGDTAEVTVAPTTLTFTTSTWNVAQTVTSTGVDESIDDGNTTTTITLTVVDGSSDDTFDPLADQTVSATNTDDDTFGITVSTAAVTTTEAGGTASFTIVLDSEPTANVTIGISSSDTTEGTVASSSLIFTAANWNTAQTMTVTGVDDNNVDGTIAYTIITAAATSGDANYNGLNAADVSANNTDDDTAGYTVSKSNVTTTEAGGTDTFTVVLTAQPTSDVVLSVTSSDAGEATVAPITLTFTTSTWNVAQTVTATGIDDSIDDGDVTSTITIAVVDASSDNTFDPLADQTVSAITTDDDTAGITVTTITATTSESGATSTFTVVLDTEPTANVTIGISSDDTTEGTVSNASLVFTSANWNVAQTITMTGVDDNLVDGTVAYNALTAAATSADTVYNGIDAADVAMNNTDDDTAGFTLSKTSATTTEAGGTDTFTVVLDAQPTSDVVISVVSSDTSEDTVNVATLTFTSSTWNVAQTVTTTGQDDSLIDGNVTSSITLAIVDGSSDNSFDPLADQTVVVTNTDDDTAGYTVSKSNVTTTEAGGTDTFTVVLTAQPTSDVVISVTANDATEVAMTPTTLTFTTSTWNVAQIVTSTGQDDALVDGNVTSSITLAIVDGSSDDTFDPLADQTVVNTNTDDDTAGFTLSASSVTTTEAGATDTFTVVLTAQPTSNVVISVTSSDSSEVTASPVTLTFTTSTWNVAQTVTATGIDDSVVDGSITSTITLAIVDASSDDTFDPLADQTVSAINTDDDVAGYTLSKTAATTTEAGGTDTFTVVLTSEPTSNVVISVTSPTTTEVTVSPATLTFTSANWNTAQTVTTTGVDESIDDGDQAVTVTLAIVDGSSDNTYDPLADQTVTVTNTDDDTAGFTVTESAGSTAISEAGTVDTFTVVLDSEPTSNVEIQLLPDSQSDVGGGVGTAVTLTFTSATWNAPQTVTNTAFNDFTVEGTHYSTTTLSIVDANSDDVFDPLTNQAVVATITDNDTATVTVSKTNATTTEAGGTDNFTVVLDSQPTATTTISVTSTDATEGTTNVTTLVFTPANWNAAQTVIITGVDDDVDDGDIAYSITLGAIVSTDTNFSGVDPADVSMSNTDNDTAGITVNKATTLTTEAGGTDTFTIVLDTEPTANVSITIGSNDTTEVTVAPTTLTFTAANWNTAQTVTSTGVDDLAADGDQVTTTTLANAVSADGNYSGFVLANIANTNTDDDVVGITVSAISGNTSEAGATSTFTIVLNTLPTNSVTIPLTSNDTSEGTIAVGSVVFTTSTWNTAQTVVVTGANDTIVDGNITYAIVTGDPTSADAAYNAITAASTTDVSVINTDDDTAGVTVSAVSASTTEAGGTATFTVVLDAMPTSTVTISVTSTDATEGTANVTTLTFTSSTWNTAQTVTVTGVDDDVDDGNIAYNITLGAIVSADAAFSGVDPDDVTITNIDDDAAGFTVTESAGSTAVTEGGAADTIDVVLLSEPTSNVVITVTSSDAGAATVSVVQLTFTSSTWNAAQTVSVNPVDDADLRDESLSLTFAIDDASSDNNFDPLADQTVTTTVTDDDAAGFTISTTTVSVAESGTTSTFSVVLDAEPTTDVAISITSANTAEATVNTGTIYFTSSTWNIAQTIMVTGIDELFDDGDQATAITLAIVDASSDNDFDPLANQTVTATTTDDDASGFAVSSTSTTVSEAGSTSTFTVVLTSAPTSDVVISVTASDTTEATASSTLLTFTSSTWNVAQTVTITGVDDLIDDGTVSSTVTMAIVDASSDDTFDPLADQVVAVATTDDDTAGITVSTISASTTESGATSTFSVVLDTEPTATVTIPISSGDTSEGTVAITTLTFTTANWNTAQTVVVTGVDDAIDDGDIAYSIVVGVASSTDTVYNGINEPDVAVTNIDNDTAGFTVVQSATTTVSEAGSTDTFTVVLDTEPTSNVVLTIVSSDVGEANTTVATLTFTSSTWNIAQTVTSTGVDDNIIDGTVSSTLTISVDDANSDNVFDPLADQTIVVYTTDDDAAGYTVTESAGSTSVDEAGTTTDTFTVVLTAQPASNVVFSVTSADTGEVTVTPSPLTFTSANWNVAQTVTTTAVDEFVDDGDQNTLITIDVVDASSDNNFDPLAAQTVSATTTDNDTTGITVTESAASTTIAEGGATDSFDIVLTSMPTSTVTITVTPDTQVDLGSGSATPIVLTFTSSTWNLVQTVTTTAVDDNIYEGTHSATSSFAVVSTNALYNGFVIAPLVATVTDNDTVGITVSTISASTTEAGTGTATFTIVLVSEPTADVTIPLSSSDTSEGTIASSSITFTTSTWNTAQTITVTGVDEAIDDGDIAYSIVTASSTSLDPNYAGINPTDVAVVNIDDDAAGISISTTTIALVEGGTGVGVTLVLDTEPTSNVVLTVTTSDAGAAIPTVTTLTFTPANWNVAQTVTGTPVTDSDLRDETLTFIVAVDDASSDDVFDPLADITVTVTVTDITTAGFTITETAGGTTVDENGTTTDTVAIVLTAQPTTDVVIALTASDATEATLSTTSITFSSSTWNVAQTITITAVDELVQDGIVTSTMTASITDASSDNNFDPLADQNISIKTLDNDVAGYTVSKTAATTTEAGATDSFTVVLDTEPTSNVVITLTVADATEMSIPSTTLTFTTSSWNAAQTVVVTGVDDAIDDGDITANITLAIDDASSDDIYDVLADKTVAVTNTDDDTFGVTVSTTTVTTTEAGGTGTFTVVLDSQPTADVTITVTSSDATEGTSNTTTLTFTTSTWNIAKTITITGIDDLIDDGDIAYSITLAAASSTDPVYNGTDPADVSVTNTDDDTASYTVTETAGSTQTSESGTTDTFDVVLTTEPTSNVVFNITTDDATETSLNVSTLTFTTSNWNTAQTVTTTGVDDFNVDGTVTSTFTIAVDDALSDNVFDALATSTLLVPNTDDDTAGYTVSKTTSTVSEAGATDTFTLVLNSQPITPVVFTVTTSNPGEVTPSVTTITFTSSTWNTPVTITLSGIDDDVDDGDTSSTITLTIVDASSDDVFDPLGDQTIVVTNTDNDTAGIAVSKTTSATDENGTTDTFTVVLNTEPTGTVTIPIASTDTTEVTISTTSITFSTTNWNVPVTVTLTGVDDLVADGNIASNITLGPSVSGDANYNTITPPSITNTNADNDIPGITVTASTTITVYEENTTTSTFSIVLDSQPTADVNISITSADTTEATVSSSTITFTNANWAVAQTIIVTAVDELIDDGDISYNILVGPATSIDGNYAGVDPSDVNMITVDNDDPAPSSGGGTSFIAGCTDSAALNYNSNANVSRNATCTYPEAEPVEEVTPPEEDVVVVEPEEDISEPEETPPVEQIPLEAVSCPLFTSYYALGDNDPEIELAQRFLTHLGYNNVSAFDGVYDTETFNLIKQFQEDNWEAVLAPWGLPRNGGTGWMYQSTRAHMNYIAGCRECVTLDNGNQVYCDDDNLTPSLETDFINVINTVEYREANNFLIGPVQIVGPIENFVGPLERPQTTEIPAFAVEIVDEDVQVSGPVQVGETSLEPVFGPFRPQDVQQTTNPIDPATGQVIIGPFRPQDLLRYQLAPVSSAVNRSSQDIVCPHFTSYKQLGDKDAEVIKIQEFLKEEGFYTYPEITGYYGSVTREAVNAFQRVYAADILIPWGYTQPTGYWYQSTLFKANQVYGCADKQVTLDNGVLIVN